MLRCLGWGKWKGLWRFADGESLVGDRNGIGGMSGLAAVSAQLQAETCRRMDFVSLGFLKSQLQSPEQSPVFT